MNNVAFAFPNTDMPFDDQRKLIEIQAIAYIVSSYLEHRVGFPNSPVLGIEGGDNSLDALIKLVQSKFS